MAAVYNQEAGNATLYVDGVAVTAQTSIPQGGEFSRNGVASSSSEQQPSDSLAGDSSGFSGGSTFSTSLRVGAGPSLLGAAEGSTGFVGLIDEAFVYGTALSVDELDYLYSTAQVESEETSSFNMNPFNGLIVASETAKLDFPSVERLSFGVCRVQMQMRSVGELRHFALSSKVEMLNANILEKLGDKDAICMVSVVNMACAHHILAGRFAVRLRYHPLLEVPVTLFGSKGSSPWRWRLRVWKKPEKWP